MFLYTISCMQGGHTTLTLIFIIFYMTAALLQVWSCGSGGAQAPTWNQNPKSGPGLCIWTSLVRTQEDRRWFWKSYCRAV